MSQFSVQFDTDNDAFEVDPAFEIARLLGIVADDVRDGETSGVVIDAFGNSVGGWTWNE